MKLTSVFTHWVQITLDRLVGEYHVASRNLAAHKNNPRAHHVHYESRIQKLVANAPLHFEGCSRISFAKDDSLLVKSLGECIRSRESSRELNGKIVNANQLGTILLHSNAVRLNENDSVHNFHRNVPSSGNLGSVEIFVVASRVSEINSGLYHFDTVQHDLALIREGEFGLWLKSSVFYQPEFADAAVLLVLVSSVKRLTSKYGIRGYRLALMDVGHVSQNIQLAATALGLNVCATAGFIDDKVDEFVSIDGIDVASMLVVAIG